jgi:hypothetical protein
MMRLSMLTVLATLLVASASLEASAQGNHNGGGKGHTSHGNGKGSGHSHGGGGSGAPLPLLGASLAGQAVAIAGGVYVAWRRRKKRKSDGGTSGRA